MTTLERALAFMDAVEAAVREKRPLTEAERALLPSNLK